MPSTDPKGERPVSATAHAAGDKIQLVKQSEAGLEKHLVQVNVGVGAIPVAGSGAGSQSLVPSNVEQSEAGLHKHLLAVNVSAPPESTRGEKKHLVDRYVTETANHQDEATPGDAIPMPTLSRNQQHPRTASASQPGAMAYGSGSDLDFEEEEEEEGIANPTENVEPAIGSNNGVPQAFPVEPAGDIEAAQPIFMEEKKTEQEKKQKQCLLMIGMVSLLALAVVLAIALDNKGDEKTHKASIVPSLAPESLAPSPAPTRVLDQFLAGLPGHSLESARNSSSPQWKGLQWLEGHPDLPGMEMWRMGQLFALATFFYSFDGPNWPQAIQDNWLLYEESECYWFSGLFGSIGDGGSYELDENAVVFTSYAQEGIGPPCNEEGRFQSIVIYDLGLNESKPSIPPEIGLLSSLSTISLMQNKINASATAFLPPELFRLSHMTHFDLFNNHLMGSVPVGFSRMTDMLNMDLGFNSWSGSIPSELGALTAMTELKLNQNLLSGSIPTEVGRFTAMKEAILTGNALTGPVPSQVGQMTQMGRLYISSNDLTGTLPSELGLLHSMVDFSLATNTLSGALPSEMALMTSLQLLRLNNNTLSGSLPPELEELVTVHRSLGLLSIENNLITGVIPEGLCMLGESFLSFDCGANLCGCCWCPCPGEEDTSTKCTTDLSLNPLLAKNEWPGQFPSTTNSSKMVTINIHTDEWQSETSWTWSLLEVSSGSWQVLDSVNTPNASSLHSYDKEVESDTIYWLRLLDSYGDGTCCSFGFGWFSVNSPALSTENTNLNGTVVWTAVGDALNGASGVLQWIEEGTSLDVFLWVDTDGNVHHMEYVPERGFALAESDEGEEGPVFVVSYNASVGEL